MNELESMTAVLRFLRTNIPVHLDGMPVIDTPEQAREYVFANWLYWLEGLLAVASAAREYIAVANTSLVPLNGQTAKQYAALEWEIARLTMDEPAPES